MTAAVVSAAGRGVGPSASPRSWSSVLAVQLRQRIEALRALAAALGDLSSACAAFPDLEESLTVGMVAVLEDVEAAQLSVETQLEALVSARARVNADSSS